MDIKATSIQVNKIIMALFSTIKSSLIKNSSIKMRSLIESLSKECFKDHSLNLIKTIQHLRFS